MDKKIGDEKETKSKYLGEKKKGGERDKRCYHMRLTLKKTLFKFEKNEQGVTSKQREGQKREQDGQKRGDE